MQEVITISTPLLITNQSNYEGKGAEGVVVGDVEQAEELDYNSGPISVTQ